MAHSDNGLTSVLPSQSPLGPRGLSEGAPGDMRGVSLSERRDLEILNVRLDGNDAALLAQFKGATGITLPTDANTWSVSRHVAACWLSPDEWIMLGSQEHLVGWTQKIENAMAGAHFALTVQSSGYTIVRIEGANAADLLAKGCTLDFEHESMSKSRCAQTNIAKTGALVIVRSPGAMYDVVVRRSFADYLYLWLSDGAKEYGGTWYATKGLDF